MNPLTPSMVALVVAALSLTSSAQAPGQPAVSTNDGGDIILEPAAGSDVMVQLADSADWNAVRTRVSFKSLQNDIASATNARDDLDKKIDEKAAEAQTARGTLDTRLASAEAAIESVDDDVDVKIAKVRRDVALDQANAKIDDLKEQLNQAKSQSGSSGDSGSAFTYVAGAFHDCDADGKCNAGETHSVTFGVGGGTLLTSVPIYTCRFTYSDFEIVSDRAAPNDMGNAVVCPIPDFDSSQIEHPKWVMEVALYEGNHKIDFRGDDNFAITMTTVGPTITTSSGSKELSVNADNRKSDGSATFEIVVEDADTLQADIVVTATLGDNIGGRVGVDIAYVSGVIYELKITDTGSSQENSFETYVTVKAVDNSQREMAISLPLVSTFAYKTCIEVASAGKPSGKYELAMADGTKQEMYCESSVDGGGWTLMGSVHQSREANGNSNTGDDLWSGCGGTYNANGAGAAAWTNGFSFGTIDEASSGDYKNPEWQTVKGKNMMIWFVPNDVALESWKAESDYRFYTESDFLEKQVSSLTGTLPGIWQGDRKVSSRLPKGCGHRLETDVTWDSGTDRSNFNTCQVSTNVRNHNNPTFDKITFGDGSDDSWGSKFAICPGFSIASNKCANHEHNCIGGMMQSGWCGDRSYNDYGGRRSGTQCSNNWNVGGKVSYSTTFIFIR